MTKNNLPKVAYFCMEYGLESDFKLYAGGLGILAGDYLKGAKDEGYPIVGVGIKWKQGYTDKMIDEFGQPYDTYHNYTYDFLEDTGVLVDVYIRRRKVSIKVWKCEVFGNATLYLLDTDLDENPDSWITGQLYGWFGEERIAQEMVLGIGGVRALKKLGIVVDVYHFNEGHALFAGFELMREELDQGIPFEIAWSICREKIVFTTHTPVLKGNESHPIDRLMYMGANLGMTNEQLIQLGGDPFNMTVGALRLAHASNTVAQLHGNTSRKMWAHISQKAPIQAITNGIHLLTWVDPEILRAVKDAELLWEQHQENKRTLINFVFSRTGQLLEEDKLLIGFARRAVPYKRSDLIFSDPDIISPLLENQDVQLIFAGRAHPLDDVGKAIAAGLVAMMKKYPSAVVYLENYDMEIGAWLTRGSDVWLNNPRRLKEACGTSGMKAAMNGVLNLSILDGWWPEACEHGVNGWQFGDGFESDNEKQLDDHDQKALYRVLLEEVIPTYYDHQDQWIKMMQASIHSTIHAFSMQRMLAEYYEKLYSK